MKNLPLRFEQAHRTTDDDQHRLDFTVSNTTDNNIYEFVKLFVGDTYIGLTFLDLDPEEQRTASFKVDKVATSNDPAVVLTMNDRSDGVLFKKSFTDIEHGDGAEEDAPHQEEQEPVEEPSADHDEQQEKEETEPDNRQDVPADTSVESKVEEKVKELSEDEDTGIISKAVDSLLGRSDKQPEPKEEPEQPVREDQHEEDETDQTTEPELLPSEQVNRLKTGIINLDGKMQGGLVEGTMNLITGKTGTGKTAFCASFLKKGAEEGQPGVYVTTEEREEDIKADIESMFGWDFDDLEDQGKVKILSIKPIFPSKEIDNLNRLIRSYISNLLDQVMHAVDEIDADRVIIDSVSIIEMFIRDEYMSRVALASLLNKLRESNVTALLTGTVPETSEGLSGGGIIEFLVDTVILLEFVPVAEEHKRTLTIRKMRRTNHDVSIFPFDITPDGIKIYEVM